MTLPTGIQHDSVTPPSATPAPVASRPHVLAYSTLPRRPTPFLNWFWFILKNAVGWLLIVSAMALGPLVPGPGGLPLFLIGFGLITFPGKRRITARVLSGAPIDPASRAFRRGIASVAVFAPALAMAYLLYEFPWLRDGHRNTTTAYVGIYIAVALLTWALGLHSIGLLNWLLRLVARGRRRIRPWLRRRGIDLLPPRRRRRRIVAGGPMTRDPDEEILSFHQRHHDRLRRAWKAGKPWVKRVGGGLITAAIFFWMLRPVARNWDEVKFRIVGMSWSRFLLASAMFAVFLFTFRATAWRWVLLGLGARLPVTAATRIWSISELARYLPGAIWQVLGRIYLVKPYGVRGSVCSASQLLELIIFLLANMLLALACLVWFGIKKFEGPAQNWLFGAMALVPVLLLLLHPRVLYRLLDRLMALLHKPPVPARIGFGGLVGLLLWSLLGLVWQSFAIWLLVREPLALPIAKWWVVGGAYALAWCAGFLAVWAPGGIGVRELVFMAAMQVALPPVVRQRFQNDPAALTGFLAFLSVLLRLWTVTGELMLTGIAYLADHRGAPRPDRVRRTRPLVSATVPDPD